MPRELVAAPEVPVSVTAVEHLLPIQVAEVPTIKCLPKLLKVQAASLSMAARLTVDSDGGEARVVGRSASGNSFILSS